MTDDLAIWWLDQHDMEAIGEKLGFHFPKHISEEYSSLHGRAGRGRLWVDEKFGEVGVDPWPDTPMSKRLDLCGGIVIDRKDIALIDALPGLITDFRLRRPREERKTV